MRSKNTKKNLIDIFFIVSIVLLILTTIFLIFRSVKKQSTIQSRNISSASPTPINSENTKIYQYDPFGVSLAYKATSLDYEINFTGFGYSGFENQLYLEIKPGANPSDYPAPRDIGPLFDWASLQINAVPTGNITQEQFCDTKNSYLSNVYNNTSIYTNTSPEMINKWNKLTCHYLIRSTNARHETFITIHEGNFIVVSTYINNTDYQLDKYFEEVLNPTLESIKFY